jgi:hypothetical protein
MKRRIMILAIVAIITMGLAMQVSAQTVYTDADRGNLASNTNTSTAGIFKNDVDNFINYHDYAKVLTGESNWFSFVSGKTAMGGALDLGYATNLGGIYLGTWFRGNLYNSTAGVYETKTVTPTYNDALELLTQRTDDTYYDDAWHQTANNIEFLIGVSGMGIKVGFFESTASNKNDGNPIRIVSVYDYQDGRKGYTNAIDEYSVSESYLKPYIGWGASFPVGDMTLYPYVDLGFGMYGDKMIDKYRDYDEVNGVKQDEVTYVGAGWNNGYMLPQGTIGAKIDLPKNGTKKTTLELSYNLNLYLYSNNYDDTGLSGSADGTVSWSDGYVNRETKPSSGVSTLTQTDMSFFINEITKMQHTITPSYKITGEPGDDFKLGFKASIPVTIRSETSNPYTKQIVKDVTKYDWDMPGIVQDYEKITYYPNTETSYLNVRLALNFGASYQLIPDRFAINAGIAAVPVNYSRTVERTIPNSIGSVETYKETQDDGSVIDNNKTVTLNTASPDSVTIDTEWAQYTATLRGGFTFMFNSNAALDMGASVGGANSFNLDVTTVNVIFTFKY